MLTEMSAELDRDTCDRARLARDAAYDGLFFIGVRTTRIYCRPVCPARPAKSENVVFFPTAAAAERAGFRPCLRCRPETAPRSPAWTGTATTVARGMRLIEEGFSTGHRSPGLPGSSGSARGTSCGFFFATPVQPRARSRQPCWFSPLNACSTKPRYPYRGSLLRLGSEAYAASMRRSARPMDGASILVPEERSRSGRTRSHVAAHRGPIGWENQPTELRLVLIHRAEAGYLFRRDGCARTSCTGLARLPTNACPFEPRCAILAGRSQALFRTFNTK
jgi:methylphosphotriester-DNA--protein-cysteine methyltransferase